MIFKKNINEEEKLLLKALIQSGTIYELNKQLPEFPDYITLTLKSLMAKLNKGNTQEDFLKEFNNLRKIILKKIELVKNKNYEDAARQGDYEYNSLKKLNLGLKLNIAINEFDSYVNELKEHYISKKLQVSETSSINLLIQPGTATKEDIGELLSELSILYRMLGGSGINFKLEGIRYPKFRYSYE